MTADLFALAEGAVVSLETEPVTTTQLVRYAGASGDFNRIHYDQAFAVEAGLGGVIAHGMLTMAFMGRALGTWIGATGRVRRLAARFASPVRPGDRVRVEACVTRAFDGTTLACRLEAFVGTTRVAVGEAIVGR